jgi:hypothetical protein
LEAVGKETPQWFHKTMEEAFWKFVDQKWRDSLNIAAAEPAHVDYSMDIKRNTVDKSRRGGPIAIQEEPDSRGQRSYGGGHG